LNERAVDLPNVRGTAIADPWEVAAGAAGEVADGLSGSFRLTFNAAEAEAPKSLPLWKSCHARRQGAD
jgi:hypothetical protein